MVHATEPVQTVFNGFKYIFHFLPHHTLTFRAQLFYPYKHLKYTSSKTAGNCMFQMFNGGKGDQLL
jgi:hypothetical protein